MFSPFGFPNFTDYLKSAKMPYTDYVTIPNHYIRILCRKPIYFDKFLQKLVFDLWATHFGYATNNII